MVGAFVLVLGAVLMAGVLWLASGGAWQKKFDLYMAIEEESVAGLNLNAPVKYNGVAVGRVQDIRLDPANPERVELTLAIERGTPIKQDTLAVLMTQGLTGIAFVELSGGARNAPPLPATTKAPYPVIRTKPSLGARLENVLTTVLAKLDHTSSNIDAVLSDANRAAFASTLTDIAAVAHTLAARKDALDAGITNAALTFDHTARGTVQLGPVIDRIGRSADAVQKMGDQTALASSSAGRAFDSVEIGMQRFNAETAPQLQDLVGELNDLSISLRRLSQQTERNPSGFLLGRSPVPDGPGEAAARAAP